jgi:hypothetical protein
MRHAVATPGEAGASSASRVHAVGKRTQWAQSLVAPRCTDGGHVDQHGLSQLRGVQTALTVDRILVPRVAFRKRERGVVEGSSRNSKRS